MSAATSGESIANPRIVITGVRPSTPTLQPKGSAYSLDWLQYSVPWPKNLVAWPSDVPTEMVVLKSALPRHEAIQPTGEPINPLRNYAGGHQFTFGRVYWHPKRPAQKINVVLSGDDLNGARARGVLDENLIKYALDVGSNIPRLDFALDVFIDGAHPLHMYAAWKAGDVETTATKVSPWTSGTKDREGKVTETSTVYFGAETSDRRVRIYDKAAERGVAGPWVRIELVTRDERAVALAKTMRSHGIEQAGRSAISEFMRNDTVDWWIAALTGPVVPLEPIERKITNTERWLMMQVAPVLERIITAQSERNEYGIHDLFQSVLDRNLRVKNAQPKK